MLRPIAAVLTLGALMGLSAACTTAAPDGEKLGEPVRTPDGSAVVVSYEANGTSYLAVTPATSGSQVPAAVYPESVEAPAGVAVRIVKPSAAPSPRR
jgi:hypothetical protein